MNGDGGVCGGSSAALLHVRGNGTEMSGARNWGQGFEPKLIPLYWSYRWLRTGTHKEFTSH